MPSYSSILDEIKSRLDIVDVISEYVPLKKAGQNWRGLCPFHTEKTPSFMVSPSKQIFHCFGCGTGGDVFTFLVKYEDLSFQESLNILAKKAGVTLKKFQGQSVKTEEKENLLNLHKDALIFYQQSLKQNTKAESYLERRGITRKALGLFSIGYAPAKWSALIAHLQSNGYKTEAIKKAGLITYGGKNYHDTFRNRIIFPIFNLRGEVIAFGGRVMDDSMPKYLNSSETPIFNKSRILYGLSQAKESIKKTGFAILVEGYLDVITAHMYGFTNAVAPLGTALTREHGKLIKRFTDEVVLVFDGDASGKKAAKNAIGILSENALNVKVLPLPEGEDPDSFLKKKGKNVFGDLLEKGISIVDFFVIQTGIDSRRKNNEHLLAREALVIISKIPDSVLQGYYVKLLSEKLKINEVFIREELRKIKKNPRHKIASGGELVKASSIRSRARPMDEVYLLQLILQFPEKSGEIFNAVSMEDLEDHVTKAIFKKMKNGLTDYSALLSECDEDEKALLTELSFMSDFENPEKILKDCLNRLKSKKLQMLLHELQDKIKMAELEKNKNLLTALQLEQQKLLKLKAHLPEAGRDYSGN